MCDNKLDSYVNAMLFPDLPKNRDPQSHQVNEVEKKILESQGVNQSCGYAVLCGCCYIHYSIQRRTRRKTRKHTEDMMLPPETLNVTTMTRMTTR